MDSAQQRATAPTEDIEMQAEAVNEQTKPKEIEMRAPPAGIFAETLATERELFREEQLAKIGNGEDAHIDDPDLMSKKQALGKQTPLGALNVIKQKLNLDSRIDMKMSESSDPVTMLSRFTYTINLGPIVGAAEESNKKTAQHHACQNFLKQLFRPGTTWQEMLAIVVDKDQQSALETIVNERI